MPYNCYKFYNNISIKMTPTQLNSFQGNLSDRTNALVMGMVKFQPLTNLVFLQLNVSQKENSDKKVARA